MFGMEAFPFFVQNVAILFLLYLTGGVGAICFIIVIVIIGLIFYCRDKGDYETKEAKGADIAENADVAVVFNQTGVPDIAKRQEFFM